MVKYRWICRQSLSRLRQTIRTKTSIARLLLFTLCFNIHVDKYYVADTAMEPLFWVVDHFTKFFGPLFVTAVCLLITSAVAIAYVIGIPYWWHRSPAALAGLFIVGHWLLINIVFHYIMAAITEPGYLPTGVLIPEAVSICKKCIAPKPPRTHHCSVCNRCILKMDHHCPWLNNCIGHFNHRYFFMFMAYMVGGVLFLIVFGYGIVTEHLWPQKESYQNNNSTLLNYLGFAPNQDTPFLAWIKMTKFYHNSLMYLTFLCVGVLLTLGGLVIWHAFLITQGQTSIESLINKAERIRCRKEKKSFINPYDFGPKENWRLFLGLQNGRNWRHILFPSWHKPIGTGLQWPTVAQRKHNV